MWLPLILQILVGPATAFPHMGSLGQADVTFKAVASAVLKHDQDIQFFITISNSTEEQKSALPAVVPALLEYAARNALLIEFGRRRKLSFPQYCLKNQGTKIVNLNFPEYTEPNATKYDPREPFWVRQVRIPYNKYRDIVIHLVNLNFPWEGVKEINKKDRNRVPLKILFLFYSFLGGHVSVSLGTLQLFCPMDAMTALMSYDDYLFCQLVLVFEADENQRHSSFGNFRELEDKIGRIRSQMLCFPLITSHDQDAYLDVNVDYAKFNSTRNAYIQKPSIRLI